MWSAALFLKNPINPATWEPPLSSFEKYDETSHHYDTTRQAVGSEIILGCLAGHEKPLSELRVLDAGCGTGAYSAALVDRVAHIDALDLSQGMLAQARAKLDAQARAGRIGFHQGSITELPFDNGAFDAVSINQVVHHLGDAGENFVRLRQVIGEFARVLRPGGILVMNHCSQEQLRDAYWYYRLTPNAYGEVRRNFAPLEALRGFLEDAGFAPRGSFVPVDAICQGAAYSDGRGPLDKAWRDGDSFWALVEAQELAAALDRVRALDDAGNLDAFVAEHDARRPSIGQITFVCAARSG